MANGKVILLNGISSSGKSSLAQALQKVLEEPYLHANADAIKEMSYGIPEPDKGDAFARWTYMPRLYAAIPGCFAAIASLGNNLIIDDVIKPLQIKNYVECFTGIEVLFVSVMCSVEELVRRESERGDRRNGQAAEQVQAGLVHALGIYDIVVDTSVHSPELCAHQITEYRQANRISSAFERLSRFHWEDVWQSTDEMDKSVWQASKKNTENH